MSYIFRNINFIEKCCERKMFIVKFQTCPIWQLSPYPDLTLYISLQIFFLTFNLCVYFLTISVNTFNDFKDFFSKIRRFQVWFTWQLWNSVKIYDMSWVYVCTSEHDVDRRNSGKIDKFIPLHVCMFVWMELQLTDSEAKDFDDVGREEAIFFI